MKNLLSILLTIAIGCYTNQSRGQQKPDFFLTIKEIVGIWQKDSPRVGNGLNQNFVFLSDGNFIFNNGQEGNDVTSTIKLKGRYRLVKDKLYLTIISRVVLDSANVSIVMPDLDLGIFAFKGGKLKEIKEVDAKEIKNHAYITVIK